MNAAYLAVALLVVATIHDLRTRLIPDWISVALLGLGGLAWLGGFHDVGWMSLLGGSVLAFLAGLLLFAIGAMGGGDVKLLTGLGAVLGLSAMLSVLYWMAIVGGVHSWIAKRRGEQEIAYVPAITLGLCIHLGSIQDWSRVFSV